MERPTAAPGGVIMRNTRFNLLLFAAVAAVTLLASAAAGAQPLTPVHGSPFLFNQSSGSSCALPSPDGAHVFVTNQTFPTNFVSAFPVNSDGTLGGRIDYPTGGSGGYDYWGASSLAARGGRLFALNGGTFSDTGSNDISVFDIAADGSLTPVAGS